jgi:hypothetical protein
MTSPLRPGRGNSSSPQPEVVRRQPASWGLSAIPVHEGSGTKMDLAVSVSATVTPRTTDVHSTKEEDWRQ